MFQILERSGGKDRTNVTRNLSDGASIAVFFAHEVQPWQKWEANRFNYTRHWIGPYEVNFDYYPSWTANDRLVIMSVERAMKLDVF